MRRVVITGLGVSSSLGDSPAAIRKTVRAGQTAFAESAVLPGISVCPVCEESTADPALAKLCAWRHRRYLARGAWLAVLAGLRACLDAGLARADDDRFVATETYAGLSLLGCAAPTLDVGAEPGLPPNDPLDLDALWLLRWLPNTALGALAMLLQAHGEGLALGAACASGLAALGEGYQRVAYGLADCVLVACGDSRLSLGGLLGYAKAKVLSKNPSPQAASRPFDAKRTGFVPGEGGAAFVLESLEQAQARKAHIWAEVAGYGASLDASSLTAPDSQGRYAEAAVRTALAKAKLAPADIAWVAAHGTGTPVNDPLELAVLDRVFGQLSEGERPQLTAVKSWIGHTSAACGALEAAICLACLQEGFVPPIRNLDRPLPTMLPYVRAVAQPGAASLASHAILAQKAGLVESFGFGGQNAALVLKAAPTTSTLRA